MAPICRYSEVVSHFSNSCLLLTALTTVSIIFATQTALPICKKLSQISKNHSFDDQQHKLEDNLCLHSRFLSSLTEICSHRDLAFSLSVHRLGQQGTPWLVWYASDTSHATLISLQL